jgi:hypothetical protein
MQDKNNGIADFLNADPEQKAFGVETQIRNLMTQYEMAVRNNDKDLASMLNKEINDLEAVKIKIMADALESSSDELERDLYRDTLLSYPFYDRGMEGNRRGLDKYGNPLNIMEDRPYQVMAEQNILEGFMEREGRDAVLESARKYRRPEFDRINKKEIPKLADGMNQFGMISLMKSMEDENKGMLEGILDIFNKDAQDEAEEDLNNFNSLNEDDDLFYDFEKDGGVAIDIDGKSPSEIGEDIATMGEPSFMEKLAGLSDSPKNKMLTKGQTISSPAFRAPQVIKLARGGIADYDFRNFDINDYLENILGIDTSEDTEEDMATALARAYGAPSEGIGSYARSMGYQGTQPGQEISIDAQDKTPAAYRFYPSEVSKIYAQAKGVPFSPLVAPPREATFIDDLQPRRIASQLYAKDGTFVERDQLVTGPGGERGDQIPAMLSDGEFVTNSAAVRGMGIAAGADPQDEYEQRLLGAREMYKMQKFGEQIAKQLV